MRIRSPRLTGAALLQAPAALCCATGVALAAYIAPICLSVSAESSAQQRDLSRLSPFLQKFRKTSADLGACCCAQAAPRPGAAKRWGSSAGRGSSSVSVQKVVAAAAATAASAHAAAATMLLHATAAAATIPTSA